MVRATYAEVKKLFGGNYPGSWDDTSVGNLCAMVDDELDAFEISTSDASAIELANLYVYRRIIHAQWAHGDMTRPEPVIWTKAMQELKDKLSDEGTYEFATTVDTVDEDG